MESETAKDVLAYPEHLYDLLIIGGGPAGLNAAMYASRKGLDVAVLSTSKGGQLLNTAQIENYLGTESIKGYKLAHRFAEHIQRYDIPIREFCEVSEYRHVKPDHEVALSGGETFRGRTLLIATGTVYRKLGVPGENKYAGSGVSYCAICDAPLFKNKEVIIVGGGNSAVEAVLDLTNYADKITLVHRSKFRADKVLLDRMEADPKVTVCLRMRIIEVLGDDLMQGVIVENLDTGETKEIKADGLFVEIGHIPNSDIFKSKFETSESGSIITNRTMATNIPGVFAAGNVRDFPYQQIVIAASDGAVAALSASNYLNHDYAEK